MEGRGGRGDVVKRDKWRVMENKGGKGGKRRGGQGKEGKYEGK